MVEVGRGWKEETKEHRKDSDDLLPQPWVLLCSVRVGEFVLVGTKVL